MGDSGRSAGAFGPSVWRKDGGAATLSWPLCSGDRPTTHTLSHTHPGALGFTSILVLRHISLYLY